MCHLFVQWLDVFKLLLSNRGLLSSLTFDVDLLEARRGVTGPSDVEADRKQTSASMESLEEMFWIQHLTPFQIDSEANWPSDLGFPLN